MSNRVNENIMILGITGTGKSSLINYLFGEKKLETGTGKPVTEKNNFRESFIRSPLKEDVSLHIYDSWGLEADKAKEWEKTIRERLTANYDFANIMHGIVYCVSYANDRIQEFETTLINTIIESGYRVIVAFTKADNRGYDEKKKIFRDIFSKGIKAEYHNRYTTVDVCACPVKKIGQTSATEPFGRDELLEMMEKNVSESFFNVVLGVLDKWKSESLEKTRDMEKALTWRIDQFYISVYDFEDFVRRITTPKTKRAKELVDEIAYDLEKLIRDIFSNIQKSSREMSSHYALITCALIGTNTGRVQTGGESEVDLSGVSLADGSFEVAAASFIVKCIPVFGLFQMALEKGFLQDELRGVLKTNIENICNKINEFYSQETALIMGKYLS